MATAGCERVVRCDVAGAPADLSTVDALARLLLLAHRHGRRVVVDNATEELRDLLALAGLSEMLFGGS